MSSPPLEPQTPTPPLPPAYAPPPPTSLPKNPWLAVIFSILFPGLGQVYNGELAKAFVFFAAFVGSISLVAHGNPFPFAFFIPFIFFFALIDAWKGAPRRSTSASSGASPWKRRRSRSRPPGG